MGRRNNGLSEQWAVGIMGCRNNGSSELWAVGIMTRNHKEERPGPTCTEHLKLWYSLSLTLTEVKLRGLFKY